MICYSVNVCNCNLEVFANTLIDWLNINLPSKAIGITVSSYVYALLNSALQ